MGTNKDNKNLLKRIIGDFSGVQWKDLDHKKVYGAIALLLAIIILAVAVIVKNNSDEPEMMPGTVDAPSVIEEIVEEVVEEENPLEVDAYEEINELVQLYFQGLSSGNLAMIEETVDVLSEEEKAAIEKKKDYIEAYNDVTCYTKKGLEEGSYVVFASYEMKIYNIETAAPGIMALYVCTDAEGDFYIFNGDASEELANYVLELASEQEVASVIADVDARYQQLLTEDEDLGKFAQTMLESQQQADAEEDAPAPAVGEGGELEEPVKTTVNDGIRIREGRSTETRMIATIVNGTEVKVYASYEDGWSKIEYSGTVGYCKTEFLTSTEGVPMISAETEAEAEEETEEVPEAAEETADEEDTEEAEETEDTSSEEVTSTAVNRKMKLTDAVRVRRERTTDSDILKLAYKNELVNVLANYSDGWSKVDYNGTVGYCKTEFLTDAD